MRCRLLRIQLLLCAVVIAQHLFAQYDTQQSYLDIYDVEYSDPFSEVIRYYYPPVEVRRRGLDWWVTRDIERWRIAQSVDPNVAIDMTKVSLSASTSRYLFGASVETSRSFQRGWSTTLDIDLRTGRDANIMGLFSQDFRAALTASRIFSNGNFLSVNLDVPHLTRGLQSYATEEAIELTGDNLYNPSWGFYDGEVRNSRVSKNSIYSLDVEYNVGVGGDTKLALTAESEYGRKSLSRLGWYDAYNPQPDYYRKLPSYFAYGDPATRSRQCGATKRVITHR